MLWALVALIVAIPGLVLAGLPIFVYPQIDPLRHADAIVVLGGPGLRRYEFGLDLARQGYASTVVFSNPIGPDTDVTEVSDPCHAGKMDGFTVQCFGPNPDTTKGEAEEIGRLAKAQNWKTLIVVTFTPHISRARYIVEKCFSGDIVMAASPKKMSPAYWAWMYIYQTAGYVRAFLDRGC